MSKYLYDVDLIIHTGDFTNKGTEKEFKDFDNWVKELKQAKPDLMFIVICGNHEYSLLKEENDKLA